ncbi:hypothetical protein AB8U03_13170 [Clostridium sp. Mt-5]|uniref:Uncharacterized protein n=1 Tax=Clostridium moutaii TaxID=3240932 RepID=A0ABV4BTS8_9CLOT
MNFQNGKILANTGINSFLAQYRVLELTEEQLTDNLKLKLIGCKKGKHGYSALIRSADCRNIDAKMSDADLESIMVHLERE